MTETHPDLQLALSLADAADGITVKAFGRTDLLVETKADRTPVTEADKRVELALRERLAVHRPGDAVVGEEFGQQLPASASGASTVEPPPGSTPADGRPHRRWIIDPIDGTKNFVRRIPVWATLLALEVAGCVQVAVVSAPALGRRWWASRGAGAFTGGPSTAASPIAVSGVRSLSDAYVSANSLSAWPRAEQLDAFLQLAARCSWDRNMGDFWSHVLVAEGACDVGIDPVASVWDLAAVKLIVEEAGGKFTDLVGVARADGGSGVSSNGLLHDEALALLNGRTA